MTLTCVHEMSCFRLFDSAGFYCFLLHNTPALVHLVMLLVVLLDVAFFFGYS